MKNDKLPIMLTVREAIDVSGLTRYCIMQLVHENKIAHIRSGKKIYINYGSLTKYLSDSE